MSPEKETGWMVCTRCGAPKASESGTAAKPSSYWVYKYSSSTPISPFYFMKQSRRNSERKETNRRATGSRFDMATCTAKILFDPAPSPHPPPRCPLAGSERGQRGLLLSLTVSITTSTTILIRAAPLRGPPISFSAGAAPLHSGAQQFKAA